MKAMRVLWLVLAFVALLPLIVVFEIIWLFVCIRAAYILEKPMVYGVQCWIDYIKYGISLNKDFVLNGL